MQKFFSLLLLRFVIIAFLFLFTNIHLFSQIQYSGSPVGLKKDLSAEDVEVFSASLTETMKQKKQSYPVSRQPGEAMHAGFALPAGLEPRNSGSWELVGDSLRIWRLKVTSPGALALGLVFDDFDLSVNSRMFVYSEDKETVLGSFDHRNTNEENVFTTQIIPGNTIIIEYEEDVAEGEKLKKEGKSLFSISEVVHISIGGGLFRETSKSLGSSEDCQVHINCPEGDDWQKHKRSVARMLMKVDEDYYWCTGALVNNTAQDGKPYLLSASHCGEDAYYGDMLYWHFYFNFERPGCADVGTPPHNMIHGSELISEGPLEEGSDFKLLLLREPPPSTWDPYYSGWSTIDEPANSGAGIHHPAGDAKMISTYNETLSSATAVVDEREMAPNSTWKVEWDSTETNWSVPESGSSGSPIFNEEGLVVGTLTGGSATCEEPDKPDFYGKMSYHWESNDPEDEMRQLKPYLDPKGTGVEKLEGYDPYYVEYPPPGFLTTEAQDDENIHLKWYRPGSTPNREGWLSYVYDVSHLAWATPERATLFDDDKLDFTFPATLEKISHVFVEHDEHQWAGEDETFTFKIYGPHGEILYYESPELVAEPMKENVYTLDEPLVMEDKFYVAVQPLDESGHPSTAMKLVNYGATNSFLKTDNDYWTPYANIADEQEFEFLTRIYITASKGKDPESVQKESPVSTAEIENKAKEYSEYSFDNSYDILYKKHDKEPGYYRIYCDDEMIKETEDNEVTTFPDENPGYGFYNYYVTAVYDGDVESKPSNEAYVLLAEPCQEFIDQFPYKEVFDVQELDECWMIEAQSSESWQFTSGYTVEDTNVEPVEGDNFMFIPWLEDELQNEWLITSPIDLGEIDKPALMFWFNGSYTWSVTEENCRLDVYASVDDGAFHKIWDHADHPGFDSSQYNYEWLQALINLAEYGNEANVRLAFKYEGQDGASFAIDKIEVIDAAGMEASVKLEVKPEFSGIAKGEGTYMEGEPVTIKAEPNIEYKFKEWETNAGEIFSHEKEYTFSMPSEGLNLTAVFLSVLSVDERVLSSDQVVGYPNPTSDKYNVLFNKKMENVNINVYDMQGNRKMFYEYNIIEPGYELNIDIEDLSGGLYLVKIIGDNYRETLKVSIIE